MTKGSEDRRCILNIESARTTYRKYPTKNNSHVEHLFWKLIRHRYYELTNIRCGFLKSGHASVYVLTGCSSESRAQIIDMAEVLPSEKHFSTTGGGTHSTREYANIKIYGRNYEAHKSQSKENLPFVFGGLRWYSVEAAWWNGYIPIYTYI